MRTRSSDPRGPVPPRALAISVAALAVPVAGALFSPDSLGEYRAMLWLLALVPAFLLAYYRGWKGISLALGIGMAVLSLTHVVGSMVGWNAPTSPLLTYVVIAYLGVALGIGWLSVAIRRAEADYRELVEHAPYGICRCSPQGEFLRVNQALVEMLGYDSEAELRAVDLNTGIDATPGGWAALARQLQESGRVVGTDVVWKRMDGTRIRPPNQFDIMD